MNIHLKSVCINNLYFRHSLSALTSNDLDTRKEVIQKVRCHTPFKQPRHGELLPVFPQKSIIFSQHGNCHDTANPACFFRIILHRHLYFFFCY